MLVKENPNRKELMKINDSINIATKGKEILQDKIDSLVALFFDYVKKGSNQRKEIETRIVYAFKDLIVLESLMGIASVKSDAYATPAGQMRFVDKKIMGVKLTQFFWDRAEKRFGSLNKPLKFDAVKKDFEEILEKTLMLGETENSIQILSSEIKASRKVVNSLENFVLPDLMRSKKWVKLRLEQMDREDLLRYKMIKRKFGK